MGGRGGRGGGWGVPHPQGWRREGIGVLHLGPWCVWELGLHLPVVTLQKGFHLGSGPVYFLVSKGPAGLRKEILGRFSS